MKPGENCSYCCNEFNCGSFIKTIGDFPGQKYCSFSCFKKAENQVCDTCGTKIHFDDKSKKILIRDIYWRMHYYCSTACIGSSKEYNLLFSDLDNSSEK